MVLRRESARTLFSVLLNGACFGGGSSLPSLGFGGGDGFFSSFFGGGGGGADSFFSSFLGSSVDVGLDSSFFGSGSEDVG